ncbi:TauD/TfdA family dioxygenase [bacterium]|jgi:alpha-ketoglutarate-dependent taurine dioxygenase|nr:TauD/TfdA family dioxygenase [bacterium]
MRKLEKETYLNPRWGSMFEGMSYNEIMDLGFSFWHAKLVERQFFCWRGLDSKMTDEQLWDLGTLVGKPWDTEGYKVGADISGFKFDGTTDKENEAVVDSSTGQDIIEDMKTSKDKPVSYFFSGNTIFGDKYMAYHSDLPHTLATGHEPYPARALLMVNMPEDSSGDTQWLDMEGAWEQMTDEEKAPYQGLFIKQQHMYHPGRKYSTFPFLKQNPWNGKWSPRLNCIAGNRKAKAWIAPGGVIKKGVGSLGIKEARQLVFDLYDILETKEHALYTHQWQNGDILLYTNWPSVHARAGVNINQDSGEKRELKRITIDTPFPDDYMVDRGSDYFPARVKNPKYSEFPQIEEPFPGFFKK